MRIYSASQQTLFTAVNTVMMELQVPANTRMTLLRAWVSADQAGTPLDEVCTIALYTNDAAKTGGNPMNEYPHDSDNATAAACVAGSAGTIGATPIYMHWETFHYQNGWLYVPQPEERITLRGGDVSPGDNIGLHIEYLPQQATFSYGMTWGEIG